MTLISDISQILKGESAFFAFLPAINYFYYYIQQSDPDQVNTGLTLGVLFISALLYNLLTNIDFYNTAADSDGEDSDTTSEASTMGFRSVGVLLIVGSFWAIAFIWSINKLYTLFSRPTIWSELLTAVSLGFVFLLVSDILLAILLPIYGNQDTS